MSQKYISLFAVSVFALMTGFNEAKSMDSASSSSLSSSDDEPGIVHRAKSSITFGHSLDKDVRFETSTLPEHKSLELLSGVTQVGASGSTQRTITKRRGAPDDITLIINCYFADCPDKQASLSLPYEWNTGYLFQLVTDSDSASGYKLISMSKELK